MNIKCIIIDDEFPARILLQEFIDKVPSLELTGSFKSPLDALPVIQAVNTVLIFLDIQMPDGDGFDLITKLSNINFNVIFTTAYSDYAIKAFKYSATHYLLKPIIADELIEAVDKASKKLQDKEVAEQMRKLFSSLPDMIKSDKLVLSTNTAITVVRLAEIIMCRSDRNYTTFYLEDGNEITVSKTLKEYENLLNTDIFFRSHRQYLVNINHIKSFQRSNGRTIKLTGDLEAPVSMRKHEQLMELLLHL